MATGRVRDPSQPSGPSIRNVRRSLLGEQYPVMVRNNRLKAGELRRLRNEAAAFEYAPVVSILMPISGPDLNHLERSLDSVLAQIYSGWELRVCCNESIGERVRELLSRYGRLDERVKVEYAPRGTAWKVLSCRALAAATGEFVCPMYAGDELAPQALFRVVEHLQDHAESGLIYSDEDEISEEGVRKNPRFKPDWSPDLLLATNYLSNLSVYRRSLLEEIIGYRREAEGAWDYGLILRLTEQTDEVHHIPEVLYHRRTSNLYPKSTEGDEFVARHWARLGLSLALERRGLGGRVEDGLLPDHYRVRPEIKGDPKVSIIIPSRDNVSLLRNCIENVERLTTYDNYEIIIMDNDSVDPETVEYLASSPHWVIPFKEKFNYSRINNIGVSQAKGEYVLLLNDDTEVISGDWIEAMLEHAQRPEVGGVGAKLIYPDGRIQHAGVVVGVGGSIDPGVATHAHQFYPSDSPGHLGTAMTITNYSAVTAACMMLRKSVFEEVGGFDEENLPVSFNDVDLCLNIRDRGYSIIYTPYAELYHHESVSRGRKGDPAEAAYMRGHWSDELREDPYYNPNFSKGSGDYSLRADFLRPAILRPAAGEDNSTDYLGKDPLTMTPEELEETRMARSRVVRDTHRNTIVPRQEKESVRMMALKSLSREESPGRATGTQPRTAAPISTKNAKHGEDSLEGGLKPEQLVWMLGYPRTGSTWLSRIMAELDNQERWHEPYVGMLFSSFIHDRVGPDHPLISNPSFIMGEPYREVWLNSIKNFILDGANARYSNLRRDQYLVIKEPNGSIAAPVLLEATPDSRMIFLIRDSRDVVASQLDGVLKGSWSTQNRVFDAPGELNDFTKHLAEEYFKVVSQVQKAYEDHPAPKALVRYEDLRHDTLGTLKAMYDALEIEYDASELAAAVEKHSWEKVPEEKKGAGKFHRKAQPGSWSEDLSQNQIEIVESVTGSILSKYY